MVQLLLTNGVDVTLTDARGLNAVDHVKRGQDGEIMVSGMPPNMTEVHGSYVDFEKCYELIERREALASIQNPCGAYLTTSRSTGTCRWTGWMERGTTKSA